MKFLSSSIITALLLCVASNSFSQDAYLDKLYQEARNHAFSNDYSNARKLCYQILQKNNKYLDARILLARTFSWDHNYDSARYHLKVVLRQDDYALDAYLAFADVEIWSNNCSNAIVLCDSALRKIPNYELYIKKIKACLCIEDALCARSTIDSLLQVYPLKPEVQSLLKQTRQGNFKNRLIVEHSFEYFSKPYHRRWHVTSLQYQRDAKWGTLMAKVNAGQLIPSSGAFFNPGALQVEADAYPLLGNGYYAYLNYGYSGGELFPEHRAGLELFKTFPRGTEISFGGRYLYFDDFSKVTIITGSFSKYLQLWWFSFRPYFSFIHEDIFQSYFVFSRKYSSQYNYIGAMLGYGISPDLLPNSTGSYEVYNLDSYQLRFDVQQRLGRHLLFRSLTGYAYEQYTLGEYRNRFNVQLYLAVMF